MATVSLPFYLKGGVHLIMSEGLRQACPECKNGEGLEGVGAVIRVAPFAECWRCDGHGLVKPYNGLEPKIKVLDHEQR